MKVDIKKFSCMMSKAEGATQQGPLMDVFEKRCPPGLWCGKKRAIPKEEEKDKSSSLEGNSTNQKWRFKMME